MINHLGLTEAEFTTSIGRLLTAGLIDADPAADRYWLTEKGLQLCRRLDGHGLFGWADIIPPQLRRLGNPKTVTGHYRRVPSTKPCVSTSKASAPPSEIQETPPSRWKRTVSTMSSAAAWMASSF